MTSFARSINIDCGYYSGTSNFNALKGVYSCKILSISAQENRHVSITGSHINGKANNDVIGIWDSAGRLTSFPRRLGNVFKNLVAFTITGGNIREIQQEDLRPYPNLVALNFHGSKIEVIEQDLFIFNPHLESVEFDSKKIRYISPDAFDELPNLRFLVISGCASVNVQDDRVKVQR